MSKITRGKSVFTYNNNLSFDEGNYIWNKRKLETFSKMVKEIDNPT